jgi:hypothetical protein
LYQLGRERRPAPSLSPGSGNLALLGYLADTRMWRNKFLKIYKLYLEILFRVFRLN